MKKTIGIVLNTIPGYSETFFINKISYLQKEGFTIFLFANKNSRSLLLKCPVITPYYLPKNSAVRVVMLCIVLLKLLITSPKVLRRFIKLERADGYKWNKILEDIYLNAHIFPYKLDWLHFGFATLSIRRENVAKAIRAKMAISLRGYDIAIFPLKNKGCYDAIWNKIDKVHTISNDLLEIAYDIGMPRITEVKKITPAIEYKNFASMSAVFDNKLINIITVSRLNWKKGYIYALHAMKILKDKGVKFIYTIIGDGDERDDLLFAAYQLGLSGDVIFTGKLSGEHVATHLKRNNVYLQPSVQEGFCNAVLEAQAAGLLCIVTDAEGLSENVLNGTTGWVVPKRNPQAIADTIIKIAGMTNEDRSKIIENAQKRVEEQFDLNKQAKEFTEFYS